MKKRILGNGGETVCSFEARIPPAKDEDKKGHQSWKKEGPTNEKQNLPGIDGLTTKRGIL